jgi:hypothetical protein
MKGTTRQQIKYFLITVLVVMVLEVILHIMGWQLPVLEPMPH